jgi:hypothetical protein
METVEKNLIINSCCGTFLNHCLLQSYCHALILKSESTKLDEPTEICLWTE